MPLPAGGQVPWPPPELEAFLQRMAEWAAWYSADPGELARVYGGKDILENQTLAQNSPAVPWYRFWARVGRRTDIKKLSVTQRAGLHVPVAADIAGTSAALLFSEEPVVTMPDAHGKNPDAGAVTTEARLRDILLEGGWYNKLLEAAETAAGLGGVYLKAEWDTTTLEVPFLAVVQPDAAIPEFRWGQLQAVTLWRTVKAETNGRQVWRHLERHEVDAEGNGLILHGLYLGAPHELGTRRDLAESDATAGLEEAVTLPFRGLAVEYVPNMLPNRRFRGLGMGQSDYAGSEGLLDAIDETWASWMRDIRLAKARIMVPEEYLDATKAFDVDQEVFVPLEIPPVAGADRGITAQQFEIRYEEHERSILSAIERVVSAAGYSPQTFGLHIEGRAESGTALAIRENKSFLTQQRKLGWFRPALARNLEKLLALDVSIFGTAGVVPARPTITTADAVTDNPTETATTIELLERAKAISTETKVKMAHPDWEEEQVTEEVGRILAEQALAVPSPVPAEGLFGEGLPG